jgi:hypothetical protein
MEGVAPKRLGDDALEDHPGRFAIGGMYDGERTPPPVFHRVGVCIAPGREVFGKTGDCRLKVGFTGGEPERATGVRYADPLERPAGGLLPGRLTLRCGTETTRCPSLEGDRNPGCAG